MSKSVYWRRAFSNSTACVLATSLINSRRRLTASILLKQVELGDTRMLSVTVTFLLSANEGLHPGSLSVASEYESVAELPDTISELGRRTCFVY